MSNNSRPVAINKPHYFRSLGMWGCRMPAPGGCGIAPTIQEATLLAAFAREKLRAWERSEAYKEAKT